MLENHWLHVKSGDIEGGIWRIEGDTLTKGSTTIDTSGIISCHIAKDEHRVSQSGTGRIAGGLIGAALLGPIGAIGGLLSGGKKRIDETIIVVGLGDGRSFTAECTQIGAANVQRIAHGNQQHAPRFSRAAVNPPQDLSRDAGERMECPACAELILRKAKICRYCGASQTVDFSKHSIPRTEGLSQTVPPVDIESFLRDYRIQVPKSPFVTDGDVLSIIQEAITISLEDSSSTVFDIQRAQAVKLNCSTLDIEKIYSFMIPLSRIVDGFYSKIAQGNAESLTEQEIANTLRAMGEVRRLAAERLDILEELAATNELLERRAQKSISRMQYMYIRKFPIAMIGSPYYVIDGYLVAIDKSTRAKRASKKRKPATD